MRSMLSLLVTCGICLVASAAQAQPLFPHADSIETTVLNADLVLIARLEKFKEAKEDTAGEVHNTTIAIEETLKIDLFTEERHKGMQMTMPRTSAVLDDWQKRGSRLLVAYNEDAPYATTLIELVEGKTEVLTADFKLLRDPAAVIKAARETLRQAPATVKRVHVFRLHVPHKLVPDTSWEPYYGTGGHLMLSVPVNQHLEKRAQEYLRSESYMQRHEGARALRYFRSDDNIALVKPLLADPGWSVYQPPDENGIEERYYGVRAEAWQTLKTWGVEVKRPVIRERKAR